MMTLVRRMWMWIGVLAVGGSALVATSSGAMPTNFNNELWEFTGENPVARNVYTCGLCTFEQFQAVPPPGPNWSTNTSAGPRILLADFGFSTPPTPPPGTPATLDLVPEIPGDDFALIARVLSATPIGIGNEGPMALAQVARGTTLFFFAGRVVHKLTAPDGGVYVLFSMSQDQTATFDPFALNGLAGMSVPAGWVYSSEVITEQLTITTPTGIADVYSTPDFWTWQRLATVPEPGIALLVAVGFAALGARRRRA